EELPNFDVVDEPIHGNIIPQRRRKCTRKLMRRRFGPSTRGLEVCARRRILWGGRIQMPLPPGPRLRRWLCGEQWHRMRIDEATSRRVRPEWQRAARTLQVQ